MENAEIDKTGLQCLRILFQQVRRNVNFTSLITKKFLEEYQQDPASALSRLAAEQQLAPEMAADMDALRIYNGPVLFQLNDGRWVLILNSRQCSTSNYIGVVSPC